MLDVLATAFERKFLFGFVSHLCNVVGVAGVVAIAIGGVTSLRQGKNPLLRVVRVRPQSCDGGVDGVFADYFGKIVRTRSLKCVRVWNRLSPSPFTRV